MNWCYGDALKQIGDDESIETIYSNLVKNIRYPLIYAIGSDKYEMELMRIGKKQHKIGLSHG